MKLLKNIMLGFLLAFSTLTSCVEDFSFGGDFLGKAPGADVTKDTVFNSADYAKRFLWTTYSKMYYGLPSTWNPIDDKMNMSIFEALSDCWHSQMGWDGVGRHYYSGSYNANTEDTNPGHTKFGYNKEEAWEAIRASWIFIENIHVTPGISDEEKEQLKAEAKVIIASRYFDMFRHFGGLPILDHAVEASNDADAYQFGRGTVEETVNFMVNLLDEASDNLPWALDESEVSNWDGRMTKAAAMGLKCKILLFAASPLFNDSEPYYTGGDQTAVTNRQVWYGEYKQELWEQCLAACEEFFQALAANGRYGLVQPVTQDVEGYRDAFRKAYFTRGSGADNPEMLISTRIRYTYGGNGGAYYFTQSCIRGAMLPTQEYIEMFPMADGTRFDWDDDSDVEKMFSDRDPRLYETALVNNAEFQGRQAELWVGGREGRESTRTQNGEYGNGYGNFKYILDKQQNLNTPTLWPYLRLSEIYLTYAEALLKNGRIGEAIQQVDIVRARVGLAGLEESNPDLTLSDPDVLMEEILRERACELGLEDVRFFDLIRNKRADLFAAQLHRLEIYRADGLETSWSDLPEAERGPRPTEFTYEVKEITNNSRAWWNEFSPKWYLSAFPVSEVNKGYGLTQNPGW